MIAGFYHLLITSVIVYFCGLLLEQTLDPYCSALFGILLVVYQANYTHFVHVQIIVVDEYQSLHSQT